MVDFKTDLVVEDAFFYDEDTKLFCATKNGTFTYDIRKQEFISKNTLQNSWLTVCKKLPGEKFAIIGGKYNPLRIIKIFPEKNLQLSAENIILYALSKLAIILWLMLFPQNK